MIDPLTELFSKNGIIGLVEHHIQQRGNPNRAYFLIDIEIDRFKELNDVMGFAAGDEIIRQVGGAAGKARRQYRQCRPLRRRRVWHGH